MLSEALPLGEISKRVEIASRGKVKASIRRLVKKQALAVIDAFFTENPEEFLGNHKVSRRNFSNSLANEVAKIVLDRRFPQITNQDKIRIEVYNRNKKSGK